MLGLPVVCDCELEEIMRNAWADVAGMVEGRNLAGACVATMLTELLVSWF